MRRKNITVIQPRTWRMDDDVSGLPSTNRRLHKLGKYTGLDGLYTEMNIKPSMGLAPFVCPQEQPADVTRFLEMPLNDFTPVVLFDFDTQDPMSYSGEPT